MTIEQIKKLCSLQHKDICYKVVLSNMPFAYTDLDIGKLEKDMKLREAALSNEAELEKMVDEIGFDTIEKTFTDKELMANTKFTYEDQRQASKEAIGEELTLEEVFKKYNLL